MVLPETVREYVLYVPAHVQRRIDRIIQRMRPMLALPFEDHIPQGSWDWEEIWADREMIASELGYIVGQPDAPPTPDNRDVRTPR